MLRCLVWSFQSFTFPVGQIATAVDVAALCGVLSGAGERLTIQEAAVAPQPNSRRSPAPGGVIVEIRAFHMLAASMLKTSLTLILLLSLASTGADVKANQQEFLQFGHWRGALEH